MSIADVTENAILNLVFSATTWANYAQNAATTPETNIIVALHTADPLDAGTQATSELTYTSYARVNVARSTGWTTAATGFVNPAAAINFPASTGAGGTATFFSTGKSGGGSSPILWSGSVSPSIAVSATGITPQLTTASSISLD